MKVMASAEEDGIPVLAAGSDLLVGWLTHRNLLSAYAARRGGRGGVARIVRPAGATHSSEASSSTPARG